MGSEDALATVAAALADALRPGDVVHLRGPLGAGKTTFVRHAARRLAVADEVTSPTFTIGNLYRGGRLPVAHLDLYRSGGLTAEEGAELAPYLEEEGVVFVEWPDAGGGILPPPTHVVTLGHVPGDERARDVTVETVRH